MRRQSVCIGAALALLAGCLDRQEAELPLLGTHRSLIFVAERLSEGPILSVQASNPSTPIPLTVPEGEGVQVTLLMFHETLEELGIREGPLTASVEGAGNLRGASEIYRAAARNGRFEDWRTEKELSPALAGFRFDASVATKRCVRFDQPTPIELGVGSPPRGLVDLGNRRVLVSLDRGFFHIDLTTGSTKAATIIPAVVGGAPAGRDDDGFIWIARVSGALTKLTEIDGTFTSSIVHPPGSISAHVVIDVAVGSSTNGTELFAATDRTDVVWYPPGKPPRLSFTGNSSASADKRRVVRTGPKEALVVDRGSSLFQVRGGVPSLRDLDGARFTAIGHNLVLGTIVAAQNPDSSEVALFTYDGEWKTLAKGLGFGLVSDIAIRGTTIARVDSFGFLDVILDADALRDGDACEKLQLTLFLKELNRVIFVADREVVVVEDFEPEEGVVKLWWVQWEE